ncbi:MAG: TMEM43 family protein [Hyphomicrobiales bacterium]|nr:TMEM43 family protein [Hyphomicrobiales bacterium]
MSDQFVEVTNESWGKRLTKALSGVVGGFLVVVVSIGVLAWNENRAVTTARALTEGAGAVITLDANGHAPGGAPTAGRLVHVGGKIVGPVPSDPAFAAPPTPTNATRLVRVVEMYQWKEEKKSKTENKLGGGTETVTTYSYSRGWSKNSIDSGQFAQPSGHQNPPLPVEGETFTVKRSLVAGERSWGVAGAEIGSIGETRKLPLDETQAKAIAAQIGTQLPVRVAQGTAYFGYEPARPQIGDLRISWEAATADRASIVAADAGADLGAWTSSNGRSIFLIRDGDVPAAAMFEEAQQANATMTWIFRAGGVFAMLVGFNVMFALVGVIGDVIPFVGSIARFATGLVAFALTAALAPLTIGLAWLAVRPLIGGAIIAVGAAIGGAAWFAARKRRAAAATAAEVAA